MLQVSSLNQWANAYFFVIFLVVFYLTIPIILMVISVFIGLKCTAVFNSQNELGIGLAKRVDVKRA